MAALTPNSMTNGESTQAGESTHAKTHWGTLINHVYTTPRTFAGATSLALANTRVLTFESKDPIEANNATQTQFLLELLAEIAIDESSPSKTENLLIGLIFGCDFMDVISSDGDDALTLLPKTTSFCTNTDKFGEFGEVISKLKAILSNSTNDHHIKNVLDSLSTSLEELLDVESIISRNTVFRDVIRNLIDLIKSDYSYEYVNTDSQEVIVKTDSLSLPILDIFMFSILKLLKYDTTHVKKVSSTPVAAEEVGESIDAYIPPHPSIERILTALTRTTTIFIQHKKELRFLNNSYTKSTPRFPIPTLENLKQYENPKEFKAFLLELASYCDKTNTITANDNLSNSIVYDLWAVSEKKDSPDLQLNPVTESIIYSLRKIDDDTDSDETDEEGNLETVEFDNALTLHQVNNAINRDKAHSVKQQAEFALLRLENQELKDEIATLKRKLEIEKKKRSAEKEKKLEDQKALQSTINEQRHLIEQLNLHLSRSPSNAD